MAIRPLAAVVLLLAATSISLAADSRTTAARVDELLKSELAASPSVASAKPTVADDATFLRRVSLDLVGTIPTPEQLTAFSLDPAPNKREKMIDKLLANPRFGENWARYWRDVIMMRRAEDRSLMVTPALEKFLADSFNSDARWDKIARQFITATGDVRENGATAIIMAQNGSVEDTTAEVSRIFLGIQLQCAQCHNHPTDRWKREQFHQLAAFFPRIAVRPMNEGEQRSFEVVHVDREPRGKARPNMPNRGSLEHRMPDLKHPEQDGKVMRPVFFVTGQTLEPAVTDAERRGKIADWITSRTDHWFAKAMVNRMWSELVGHGFYEPVDDLGPDRTPLAPKTLDYLSDQFAANRYDVKWLMRTITSTAAYSRESHTKAETEASPIAASCPQRLRGDQLFDALSSLLGIPPGPPNAANNPRVLQQSPRGRLNATFGYDPSVRRDEIAGSIPQALYLMNAPEVSRGINSRQPNAMLGQLLARESHDEAVVEELYLRALAREPKPAELATCLEHVSKTKNRAAAFEDILWSLVNSTEFLNRK